MAAGAIALSQPAGAADAPGAGGTPDAPPASPNGTDGDVVLGNNFTGNNTSNATTIAYNGSLNGFVTTVTSATSAAAIVGEADSGAGVRGTTNSGDGVLGIAGAVFSPSTGNGVHGQAPAITGTTGIGVLGEHGAGGPGVFGRSTSGEGVYGQSGTAAGTTPGQTNSGIHGVTDGRSAAAVLAENLGGGIALEGVSSESTGTGLLAIGGTTGVLAVPGTGGTGVYASAAPDQTGIALEAAGPAIFDDRIQAARSGVVSITYPDKSAMVSVPGGLTAASLVLATVQNNSGVSVVSAIPNAGSGQVKISLNKAPGSSTTPKTAKVAWFVVN
jgi:hypothetical protein